MSTNPSLSTVVPVKGVSQLMDRQNRATDDEARRLRQDGWPVSGWRLRYELLIRPLQMFCESYFLRGGRRRGIAGLVDCALTAWLHFLTWAKAWALGLPPLLPPPSLLPPLS